MRIYTSFYKKYLCTLITQPQASMSAFQLLRQRHKRLQLIFSPHPDQLPLNTQCASLNQVP